jgi:hypothetical protein
MSLCLAGVLFLLLEKILGSHPVFRSEQGEDVHKRINHEQSPKMTGERHGLSWVGEPSHHFAIKKNESPLRGITAISEE